MSGGTPSFTREVAPIIAEKCAGCHQAGRHRAVPARDREADLVARGAHRSSGTGAGDAAVAARPALAAYVGQAARTLTAQQRDARRVGDEGRQGRRPGAEARRPEARAARGREAPEPRDAVGVQAVRTERRTTTTAASSSTRSRPATDRSPRSDRAGPVEGRAPRHPLPRRSAQVAAAKALDRESSGPGWSCFGGTGLPAGDSRAGIADSLNNANWIAAWAPGWGRAGSPRARASRFRRVARS